MSSNKVICNPLLLNKYMTRGTINCIGGLFMSYLKYVEERKDTLISTLEQLVRIPSVLESYDGQRGAPFGENIDKALKTMLEIGEKDGFTTRNVDNHAGHIEWG